MAPPANSTAKPSATRTTANPDRHDHGGVPRPTRPIDRLDEIRCRLRWKMLREDPDADDDADPANHVDA